MRNPFPRLLLFLLVVTACFLPVTRCHAQQEDTSTVKIDTSDTEYMEEEADEADKQETGTDIEPVLRTINSDSIQAIKKQSSFLYITYLDSLLRDEQKRKDNQPPPAEKEEVVDDRPSFWDSGIVKLICYLVAIGLVGFVLYRLFLGGGVFFKSTKQQLPTVDLADDVPGESDLEKGMRQALLKKDYRLEVRYLFLLTLSRLGEKGILQLSTEKTNYQYATELGNKPYANRFAQLSLQYEYVWFGNFPVNEAQFTTMQQQHQQFLKEV